MHNQLKLGKHHLTENGQAELFQEVVQQEGFFRAAGLGAEVALADKIAQQNIFVHS